jgi:hypothetical protein
LLAGLEELLCEHDTAAIDAVERVRAAVHDGSATDVVEELAASVRGYDFESARRQLVELRERLQRPPV